MTSRPRRSFALAAAVSLAAVAPAAAQEAATAAPADTVRTGSLPALTLEVGTDSTMTYAVRGTERRPMMLYVETVSEVPGGFLIVGENIRPGGQSVSLDSLVVDRETLAPERHADVTPAGRMAVRFEGGRLRGTATDTAGQAVAVDTTATPGAFDYSMNGMLIGRLPLRTGYSAVLLTHDIRRGPISITLRVLGEEELTVGGRTATAWKVEVDYGRFKALRWIDQDTREDLRTSVNFGGNELVVEPV